MRIGQHLALRQNHKSIQNWGHSINIQYQKEILSINSWGERNFYWLTIIDNIEPISPQSQIYSSDDCPVQWYEYCWYKVNVEWNEVCAWMETLLSSASMYSTHSLTNSSTHKATLVGGGLLVCRLHTRTKHRVFMFLIRGYWRTLLWICSRQR